METLVLVIETDTELRSLLKRVLEEETARFQVATASDSFKALGRLLQQFYNLIILDQNVSGEDWSELAQTIRAIWPGSRILLLADGTGLSIDEQTSYMFDALIQKPFTPDQLLNTVERLAVPQS